MMGKFKRWLFNKFLPAYYTEDLLDDNARLKKTVEAQWQEIARLKAYINGLERGFRAQRKIVINGGGAVERPVSNIQESNNG